MVSALSVRVRALSAGHIRQRSEGALNDKIVVYSNKKGGRGRGIEDR